MASQHASAPLSWATRFVYDTHPALFAVFLLSVTLLKTGIWVMPNLDLSQEIAKDPFAASEQIYLVSNWLHLFLAWLVGAPHSSLLIFAAFHLVFSLGFVFVFYVWGRRQLSDAQARTSLILFACLPVSGTSFYWLGMDSLTLFLMMLALTTQRHASAAAAVGLALGMQHFEQAVVGITALAVFLCLEARIDSEKRCPTQWLAALAGGILAGKGLVTAILHYNEIVITGARLDFLRDNWPTMMQALLTNLHSVLWTLLAAGWLAALHALRLGRRMLSFWVAFALLLGVLLLVEDQTRVFAIVSFPLLAVAWLFNPRFLAGMGPRFVSMMLAVWLLVPWLWSWRGIPYRSLLFYDAALVSHALWNWPAVPSSWHLWPF